MVLSEFRSQKKTAWTSQLQHQQGSCCLIVKLCPILCDPMDHNPLGSSVPRILQARTLEWFAISFSSGIPDPVFEPVSPAWASRFFTTEPARTDSQLNEWHDLRVKNKPTSDQSFQCTQRWSSCPQESLPQGSAQRCGVFLSEDICPPSSDKEGRLS